MNAHTSDIAGRVIAIVAEELEQPLHAISSRSNFFHDLGADSLDTVQLTFEFEREFGITIPDEAAAKMLTVGDAIQFIEFLLQQHNPEP